MTRTFHLIALALVAAVAAVSSAQAGGPGSAPPKVDPLAVGYLMGLGLSPSEVQSWTTGACSQASKPALCYAPFERTAAAAPAPARTVGPGGFDWNDATIGAGAALGAALLIAGLGAMLVVSRHHRRPPAVHA